MATCNSNKFPSDLQEHEHVFDIELKFYHNSKLYIDPICSCPQIWFCPSLNSWLPLVWDLSLQGVSCTSVAIFSWNNCFRNLRQSWDMMNTVRGLLLLC